MDQVLQKHKTLFLSTLVATGVYLLWRMFFTLPTSIDGTVAVIFGVLLILAEVMGALEFLSTSYFLSDIRVPKRPAPPEAWYPDIDVFIATYNEPADILQKTINACLNMEYVAGRSVKIYVCDDGRRDEIGALCKKMGVRHLTRPDNKDAKAGNYNNALKKSSAPLIANFDADMMPRRDFLLRVVPYFYISPGQKAEHERRDLPAKSVGFIQTPQRFYNPDLFQFNLYSEKTAPNEQDYFFQEVQAGRNKCNAAICAGTNVVFSREALQEIGGYATGVITEDFATALLLQERGYATYAVPENVAHGLSPVDLKSLINQRRRWGRGCIQTLYKYNFLFGRNLSLAQKIAYWSAFLYWCFPVRRLIYLSSPILFALFSIPMLHCGLAEILVIAMPAYLLQFFALQKLSHGIRNYTLSSVYENILTPALLPSIVAELLGIKKRTFHVTAKNRAPEVEDRIFKAIHTLPHIVLTVLNIVSIALCVRGMFVTGLPFYLIIIFWLMVNLYTTSMSIFFMLGRKIMRGHERFDAAIPCEISWEPHRISAVTSDISERGLSIHLDPQQCCYIPDKAILDIRLNTGHYHAKIKGRVAKVSSENGGYRYAFQLLKTPDFENENALFAIVYDREPSIPVRLAEDNSALMDLVRNIQTRRLPRPQLMNRTQPRIPFYTDIRIPRHGIVHLRDFNFEFVLISFDNGVPPSTLTIPLDDCHIMLCSLTDERHAWGALYKVVNVDQIAYLPALNAFIRRLSNEYQSRQIKPRAPIARSTGEDDVLDETKTVE
ncbi:glycosyl transferase [Betaproteobacteria bacterium]|nr:glycosyl transferase [Betaproteobacteria bacterium]GHU42684.1 glycosyl transferase [Betaproteobacteria bacterium]